MRVAHPGDTARTAERSPVTNVESTRARTDLQPTARAAAAASAGGPTSSRTGLYVHVPFCFHKCHYCDFYSVVDRPGHAEDRQERFTDALIRELRRRSPDFAPGPATIFVGGGTPTLLRPELWQKLLEALRDLGALERAPEFTIEANPETVTTELLETLAAGGMNRISIGAQSFQPRLLETLQRWHEPASVARAVERARAAGIENVNLDLIFAIPGQTLDELHADLDALLALRPTHLACYSLIFEPNTPLDMKRSLGRIEPSEEETQRAMYETVMRRLDDAGFEHYEISNWAFGPDRRCQHNLLYWWNHNWIGVGPGAASHVDGRRWKNVPHLGRYVAESPDPPVQEVEQLDADAQRGERLMLALRLRDGVPGAWLETLLAEDAPRQRLIAELIAQGLLERCEGRVRLSEAGLFVADAVIGQLL